MSSSHYHNHYTLLRHRAGTSGTMTMFKVPVVDGSGPQTQWMDISFSQFFSDVHAVARFLQTWLQENNISPRSTVAVWFSGNDYIHFVYIIALSRALYVPQMFSNSLTNASIVLELMKKAGAKAIVYEPSFGPLMHDFSCPKIETIPIHVCPKVPVDSEESDLEDLSSDEESICFVFHTSGSTSGSPKLVPFTHRFMRTIHPKLRETWVQGGPFDSQDVYIQLGSICHAATMLQYITVLSFGACIVQPSTPRFSTTELSNMVKICGVNRLSLFSAFISMHIKAARRDPDILKLLQEMRAVRYGGVPLPPDDEDWGYDNHIPLVNVYANTECGLLMVSTLGQHPRLVRPLPTVSHAFHPVGETTHIDNPDSIQFYEFVVLADSPDLPQPHLLSHDGNLHTGDLFEKAENGYYIFRGRDDDWIKSDTTKRCDAKAIEDKLRSLCNDIIKDCKVVGNNRPSPALFIERLGGDSFISTASSSAVLTDNELKETVLRRMKEFNDRRYTHERITDQRLIFIVPESSLPRTTKGNIRRKAIEELYSKQLDEVYTLIYA